MTEPSDELLNRTFRLAHFILGDRTAAVYLATAAIDKLKIASTVQNRRLYYAPTGRSDNPASRTKVSLSRLHLLQRLVYTESELFERLTEGRGGALRQEDMVIRFVKHLVMCTFRRNSFYVALGLCRLLHNYTTGETSEIYNLLIQNPDRGPDDYYYRSRKKQLLQELKQRFGGMLRTCQAGREERFQPREDGEAHAALVRECLARFTPWETSCVLSADIDPRRDIAAPLHFGGGSPDGEHAIEINRIHTLLHPGCFERLTATLGIDPPSRRLEVPLFFVSGDGQGFAGERFDPPPLSEGEIDAMRRYLERRSEQRRTAAGGVLAVLVDRREVARLEQARMASVRVIPAEGSEWVEVRGVDEGEDLTLAIHPLRFSGGGGPSPAVVRGDGREFSFEALEERAGPGATAGDALGITYRETGAASLAFSVARRVGSFLSDRPVFLKLAFASLPALAFAVALTVYLRPADAPPTAPLTTGKVVRPGGQVGPSSPSEPAASPAPQTQAADAPRRGAAPAPEVGDAGGRVVSRRRAPRPGASTARAPAGEHGEAAEVAATRGRRPPEPPAALLAVRKVYVDPLGGGAAAEDMRASLRESLRSSGRFVLVENRGEADAVIKGSVRPAAGGGGVASLSLRLVNYGGQVVWSTESRRRGKAYTGQPSSVAEGVLSALVADAGAAPPER